MLSRLHLSIAIVFSLISLTPIDSAGLVRSDIAQTKTSQQSSGSFHWQADRRTLALHDRDGILVVTLVRPASLFGLRIDDRIVGVGEHRADTVDDLLQALKALEGQTAVLHLMRNGRALDVSLASRDYASWLPPPTPSPPSPPKPVEAN
ncbi:MAG: hypothetical protein IT473_04310 [Lysobacter sp.]|nr:hypothetical protein [Lysobacter sp.]